MATKQQTLAQIKPINIQMIQIKIQGTAPYVQARFSAKSMQAMMAKHAAGSQATKRKGKEARDFDADMLGAMHVSEEGWHGIPAAAFRNAAIDVCRMVGFKMTHAKMSVFVQADGIDVVDGAPLVKLIGTPPERLDMHTRNATGVADIRVRPMWRAWGAEVIFRYDADQFSADDVVNLIARAGEQIGIGEGRPFSKNSNGLGYGTFRIV
jgi:hypothetical protein